MVLLLAVYLFFVSIVPAAAVEGTQATAMVIKADVLYWDEGELVVKEFSGHEERLKVTPETKIEGVVGGRLKTGDKIVAQITDDRKALSIKVQIPE
ncbi:MAG: hypothetical protein JSR62_11070 [Nitrospira sp.]|nr:hypothetical protein [Nitrospira sp.]